MKHWKQLLAGILIGLLLSGLARLMLMPKPGAPLVIVTLTPKLTPDPTPTVMMIKVQVVGMVAQPGIYEILAGSTINDAIQVAGGPTALADLDLLNLLTEIEDGQRLYVPGSPETADTDRLLEVELPSLININTATQTELESLPGIGSAKAQAIIEYRTQNGYFLEIEDLLKVNGIGPSTLEQFRHLITTSP